MYPIKSKTLYSLDSSGNVRIWYMEQQFNEYRMISGIKDGALVYSDWTTVFGKNIGKKNETSDIEQCKKEIEAKYKKKLKEDYFENETDLGKSRFVQPMLAHKLKDYNPSKIGLFSGNWGIQTKLNGSRCIITKDGAWTRKGEKYLTIPHITASLAPFFSAFPDAVLDGELFNESLRQKLNELMSLVRKTKNIGTEELKQSEDIVQYHIYDGYGFGKIPFKEEEAYNNRFNWICAHLSNYLDNDTYIKYVEYEVLFNQTQLDNYYSELINNGHEGIILRNLTGGYEHKRSKNLLKHKPEDDCEVTIIDINEGKGNWAGTGKVLTVTGSHGTYNCTFKGCYEDAVQFLQDKDYWIGRTITIKYNGLTGLGTPNYAQFDYLNCLNHV